MRRGRVVAVVVGRDAATGRGGRWAAAAGDGGTVGDGAAWAGGGGAGCVWEEVNGLRFVPLKGSVGEGNISRKLTVIYAYISFVLVIPFFVSFLVQCCPYIALGLPFTFPPSTETPTKKERYDIPPLSFYTDSFVGHALSYVSSSSLCFDVCSYQKKSIIISLTPV